MVSIEKIKEKNELSGELKKHGFAVDYGDAFEQAEKIYTQGKASPEVAFPEETAVEQEQESNDSNGLEELHQRIHALERHKSFAKKKEQEYEDQISELVSKMNEMVKAINMMEMNQQSFKRNLNDLQKGAPKENSQDSNSEKPKQVETPDNSRNLNDPIDQTGIAPADVSVEKIFYSGNN